MLVRLSTIFRISLTLVLILTQETSCEETSVEDDDNRWNALFRDEKLAQSFPYPGTLNYYDFDEYKYGFEPRLWESKSFSSLILIKPEYVKNAHGKEVIIWDYFWQLFDHVIQADLSHFAGSMTPTGTQPWENFKMMFMYKVYLSLMKGLYCCEDKDLTLGNIGFGCLENDVKTRCCHVGTFQLRCQNIGKTVVKEWSHNFIVEMKFKFYVWLCLVHVTRPQFDTKSGMDKNVRLIVSFCPNPCANEPCNELPNAVAGSCTRVTGPLSHYKEGYTCKCNEKYDFDYYSKQCERRLYCSENMCDPANTEKCIDLNRGFQCICRKGFTGAKCESRLDACMVREDAKGQVPGNEACVTSQSNRCRPGLSNTFKCDCMRPYTRETDWSKLKLKFHSFSEVPPDNCQAIEDACSFVNCNFTGHGRCMPSGDWLNFICVCDKDSVTGFPLFEGDFCEVAISQWLGWSAWTLCRPECGDSCFQARQRQCRHLDQGRRSYCKGTDEEIRPCEPACQPCPNRSFSHLSGVYIKETGFPLLLAVVSLFLIQFTIMAFVQWVVSRDAVSL